MNLIASYNWMKKYLNTSMSPQQFAAEFSLRSMSVEEIISLEEKYKGIIVAEIIEVLPHPQADKLQIAKTNIGTGIVDIVCGGKNIKSNQKVVVALPGAKVKWHGEENWTTLEPAKIRGIDSHGMICAPEEIDLAKIPCGDHEIWDITNLIDAPAGTPFALAFFDNDTLFDLEVTTNRPDAMSIIGLAREASVVTGDVFDWQASPLPKPEKTTKKLSVTVENPEIAPRYSAIVIDNVKVAESPAWLQEKLLTSGHRPINNIVDITNYILHEYGQPLHAFDYSKITDGEIIVRLAGRGEALTALDGKEYELSESHLIIADSQKPLAIAGVMGGLESGTSNSTTTVVIESANFNKVSIRKTARSLNLYSDSQSMFEKGLSTEATLPALARAVEMILEIAGGEVSSELVDFSTSKYEQKKFKLRPERVRKQIGVNITDQEQFEILAKLGFSLQEKESFIEVTVPYWRDNDIEEDVDLTEEIARMYGYANIPSIMPVGEIPLVHKDPEILLENHLKQRMLNFGFTEFFSLSFTNHQEMAAFGIPTNSAVEIHNPLTADLTHMRTSLIPSLLTGLSENQTHTKSGRVFELSRVYISDSKNELPSELSHLIFADFGFVDHLTSFRKLKGVLGSLLHEISIDFSLSRENLPTNWHATRSAAVISAGEVIGYIGQLNSKILSNFKIETNVTLVNLDLSKIYRRAKLKKTFAPIEDSTQIKRDISALVSDRLEFAEIERELSKMNTVQKVELVDIYQGQGIEPGQQSITVRIEFVFSKTPTSEQIENELLLAQQSLSKTFSATIR